MTAPTPPPPPRSVVGFQLDPRSDPAPPDAYDHREVPEGCCPACHEPGEYWEDRVSVHDSIIGFEIVAAGYLHPDGRYCTEW